MCFSAPKPRVTPMPSTAPSKTDADIAKEAENARSRRRQSERGFQANFVPVEDGDETKVRKVILGA